MIQKGEVNEMASLKEVPKELQERALGLLEKSSKSGKVKAGTNEVTKAIERGVAKFVLVAKDTAPLEVVLHLPALCNEKKIALCVVESKKELGEKAGMSLSASSVAVIEGGEAQKDWDDLAKKVMELK